MKGKEKVTKPKLFIIGDAASHTGFATVTHNLIDNLTDMWDIAVLGINYYGDPHPIQNKVRLYNPMSVKLGDYYGYSRINTLLELEQPDIVLVINDPWVAADYMPLFVNTPGKKVLYTPVDSKHIKSDYVKILNAGYDHIIGYTEFAITELRLAGLTLSTSVIPHGVNTDIFKPIDKSKARTMAGIKEDWYVVQLVDRNSRRKRIDLALYYFSQFAKDKPDNVKFYYHGALVDEGYDIIDLAEYFGIKERLLISSPNITPREGLPENIMPIVYNIADVGLRTTMGEGWGLTTMEAMACKVPMIVPNYSALAEWANGGVAYIEINEIPEVALKGLNTIGGVPDLHSAVNQLNLLYNNKSLRYTIGLAGYSLVHQLKYQWNNISLEFDKVFNTLLNGVSK